MRSWHNRSSSEAEDARALYSDSVLDRATECCLRELQVITTKPTHGFTIAGITSPAASETDVTDLLVHAATRPVRRSHIDILLPRHIFSFILTGFAMSWAHQESGSSSRSVCAG